MTLPIFSPGQDPGPSFSELLRRQNGDQPLLRNTGAVKITHGTTIVALRYSQGEGLAVVPIYAGYDLRRRIGRIFKYDLTGGRYEEGDFHATGSGGRDARTTI